MGHSLRRKQHKGASNWNEQELSFSFLVIFNWKQVQISPNSQAGKELWFDFDVLVLSAMLYARPFGNAGV